MKFTLIGLALVLFVSSAIPQETLVTEPKIIKLPQATIPREAVESGLGGKVRVQVQLDESGNVTAVESVLGPDSVCSSVTRADVVALRDAARTAAMDAKYEPGAAVRTWLSFDFPRRQLEALKGPTYNAAAAGDHFEGGNVDGTESSDRKIVIPERDFSFPIANATPPPDYKGPVNTGGTEAPRTAQVVRGDQGQSLPSARTGGSPPKTISGGVLNGKAYSLPKPPYPPAARAVRASGAVSVQVLIDVEGKVFSAAAVSGHPLLRAASVGAACSAEFSPTQLMGQPVKVNGVITYNFVP